MKFVALKIQIVTRAAVRVSTLQLLDFTPFAWMNTNGQKALLWLLGSVFTGSKEITISACIVPLINFNEITWLLIILFYCIGEGLLFLSIFQGLMQFSIL